ncbi:winged helix-turn-helix transcriptional regulator [bacterium]|nr:winged helix-turn-helix transcriptional regulator [bacterium]
MNAALDTLDRTFQALAHPTRRAVLARLGQRPATVSELAEPFDLALPSFLQHLRLLESAGLVTTRKRGRVRIVQLRPQALQETTRWLEEQRHTWERRLDRLDDYLSTMEDP